MEEEDIGTEMNPTPRSEDDWSTMAMKGQSEEVTVGANASAELHEQQVVIATAESTLDTTMRKDSEGGLCTTASIAGQDLIVQAGEDWEGGVDGSIICQGYCRNAVSGDLCNICLQ